MTKSLPEAQLVVDDAYQDLMKSVTKRVQKTGSVLKPVYEAYLTRLRNSPSESIDDNLTEVLLGAREETEVSIRNRMAEKYRGNPEALVKAVTNSLRRSAGTNYQTLVSVSLANYFRSSRSPWYVSHPVPKEFGKSLAIRFDVSGNNYSNGSELEEDVFRVVPDVDVLIRNAAWDKSVSELEPVLLLSIKTSIADRGGSAARWKHYFDLLTNPCPHRNEVSCSWGRLGMSFENQVGVDITHGIVTANIYKIESDQAFADKGELHSGQARANTYMFDLRVTTRTDQADAVPEGWIPLSGVIHWLEKEAHKKGLPQRLS